MPSLSAYRVGAVGAEEAVRLIGGVGGSGTALNCDVAPATRLPKTDWAICAARVSSWAEWPVCKAVGNTARTPTIPTAITPKAITTSSKLKLCVLALRLDAVTRFMGWRLVVRVP